MRSVNKVILIGNLTRDPEMKSTTSGQSIVTFGMATNRQWKTSGGDKRSNAEFHECVAWAKLAEICNQFLRKGMLIYVEGHLKTRSWDAEDGTRRYRTEVVVQDMIILEKRSDGSGEYDEVASFSGSEAPAAPAPAPAPAAPAAPALEAAPESTPVVEAPAETEMSEPEAPAAPAGDSTLSASLDDDDNMF